MSLHTAVPRQTIPVSPVERTSVTALSQTSFMSSCIPFLCVSLENQFWSVFSNCVYRENGTSHKTFPLHPLSTYTHTFTHTSHIYTYVCLFKTDNFSRQLSYRENTKFHTWSGRVLGVVEYKHICWGCLCPDDEGALRHVASPVWTSGVVKGPISVIMWPIQ